MAVVESCPVVCPSRAFKIMLENGEDIIAHGDVLTY